MKSPAFTLPLLSLFLITAFTACHPSGGVPDCQQFKNGQFVSRAQSLHGKIEILINRQDSVETDTNQLTGAVARIAVKWTGPCTYEQRLISSTDTISKAALAARKSVVLQNTVLSATSDYYIFQTKIVGVKYPSIDTLWIKK